MNKKIITFLDLIQDESFRSFVEERLTSNLGDNYSFSKTIPKLYKYRSLSSYAINDIIDKKLSLSSIGEFNDAFDGAIHQYGTEQEIESAAEAKWESLEKHMISAQLPEGIIRKESIVNPYKEYFKRESRLSFRKLDYLGTYVSCFSERYDSTLMWAHYANSNKGFCIEYSFNNLPDGNLLKSSILPVAYTDAPVEINDLINDEDYRIYKYPLDAAVLCSALNKASIWNYEHEWRIVLVLTFLNEHQRYFPINSIINPSKIILGYHFLRPFFYYNSSDNDEIKKCSEKIEKFNELISFLQKNDISLAVMRPSIGSYRLESVNITSESLISLMQKCFKDNNPENIRFYYTIHDRLMNLLDEA